MRKILVLLSVLSLSSSGMAQEKSLEDCIKMGLDSYEPLKLAAEEVELARLKRQEAYRTMFPVLSLKAERTEGKTADPTQSPEFREEIYGASLTQSLFEGGKLVGTYRQAVASHRSAEKSREKTWQDFVYGVQEAYWKLVSAEVNLKERETVLEIIKTDMKVITEQYVLDLAVKQQFLAVKSQYLQASNHANAAKIARSKARWALAKALGFAKPVDFSISREIAFKKLEPDLDQCLGLAAGHRPDLIMQEYLVELARQGRVVADSARNLKLTFNGFFGRSASAYVTDSLNYRDDWQINARLSQSIFGNTLGFSGTKINTSPKLGQSTRTDTETSGVNLSILDGMKERTEIKQADLAYRQAVAKRDDLRKEVAMDVEEAVYSVNQAVLQVEFTEEDLKLAQEELKVAESKGKYGLSSTLELAQARNRFAASAAGRTEALASYRVSLAALNRAIGIVDRFKVEN